MNTITKKQISNIRKLRDYIAKLPKDYDHLNMRTFFSPSDPSSFSYDPNSVNKQSLNYCGSTACLVGHGPVAGIKPERKESWREYAERAFGSQHMTKHGKTVFKRIFDDDLSPKLPNCVKRMETLLMELDPDG